jgi:hypothetical protein
MLWLTRPEEKIEDKLDGAVGYAEKKYGRRVRAILHPAGESYPQVWRGVHLEPGQYVLAHHLFLILEESMTEPQDEFKSEESRRD